MAQRIQAPDGTQIEFPDSMQDADITAAMGKLYPSKSVDPAAAISSIPKPTPPLGTLPNGGDTGEGPIAQGLTTFETKMAGAPKGIVDAVLAKHWPVIDSKNFSELGSDLKSLNPLDTSEGSLPMNIGGTGANLAPMLISRAVAKPKLPTPPETIGRLMTASGDVSADTNAALQKASPTLEAAKAAGNYPKTLAETPKLLNDASQGIENQISQMAKQKAGLNVTPLTKQMAQAVREEIDKFPQDANGGVLAPKGITNAITGLADKIEKVTTLEDLDKLRDVLNGELQTYMKKNGFDQAAILRDPAKGFKARALEQVRDAIADSLSNPVYGASDIRNLRAQQSGLMNLSQTFQNQAGEAAAKQLSDSTLPAGKKLFQTGARAMDLVMNPRSAAKSALLSPASADALVNAAFAPRPNYVPGVIGSLMSSMQKPKGQPEQGK